MVQASALTVSDEQNTGPSDFSLLGKVQSGEEDAAYSIYMRYAQRLLHLTQQQTGRLLASRVDAEDIVQSVFRTFFRRASAGQYSIPEGEELWKLLLVISLNKIRIQALYHRAAKRDVGKTHGLETSSEPSSDRQSEAEQILRLCIEDLLNDLPEASQQAIRLRIEGYEVKEIAAKTRRSKRTIERVLQTFRDKLREHTAFEDLA